MKHLPHCIFIFLAFLLTNNIYSQEELKMEQKKLQAFHEYSLKTLRAFNSSTDKRLMSHFKALRDLASNAEKWLKLPPTKRDGIRTSMNKEMDKFIAFQSDPVLSAIANYPCIKECMMVCKEPSGKPDYLCRADCYRDCPPW